MNRKMRHEMKRQLVAVSMIVSAMTFVICMTMVAPDRLAAKSPNGIAMSELKGYEESHMIKDAKGFPETNGWGYARFRHGAASGTFAPYGKGPALAKADCQGCHINGAKVRDDVFTVYPPR